MALTVGGRVGAAKGDVLAPGALGHEIFERPTDELLGRVAEERRGARVRVDDAPVRGDEEDAVGSRLDEREPSLGGLALAQVSRDLGEARDLSVLVTHGGDDDVRPEAGAVLPDAPPLFLEASVRQGERERALRGTGRPGLGRIEDFEVLAEDLVGGKPRDCRRPRVPARDPPSRVEQDDCVVLHRVDEEAEAGLRRAHGLLGAPLRRHVHRDQATAGPVGRERQPHRHGRGRAPLDCQLDVAGPLRPPEERLVERLAERGAAPLGDELGEAPTHELRAHGAEQVGRGEIQLADRVVTVEREVGGGGEIVEICVPRQPCLDLRLRLAEGRILHLELDLVNLQLVAEACPTVGRGRLDFCSASFASASRRSSAALSASGFCFTTSRWRRRGASPRSCGDPPRAASPR